MTRYIELATNYTTHLAYLWNGQPWGLIYKIGNDVNWSSIAGSEIGNDDGRFIFSATLRVV